MKLQEFDLSYFLVKTFLVIMVFKIIVYQPAISTLEIKEDNGTVYAIGWKSNGVYTSCVLA